MTGMGTIVNAGSIIAGGVAGTFIGHLLPDRLKKTVMQSVGLVVLFIGFSGALQGIFSVAGKTLEREFLMIMVFSLVLGALLGESINIEGALERGGDFFRKRFTSVDGNFTEGFISMSLMFCVGAMAIVGSLEDGLSGNHTTLFAKAVLDGTTSMIFAATLGIGVAFSALPVFLYQGAITLMAGSVQPYLNDDVIRQISIVGSILIASIGMNILGITKIRVGNLLPGIFLPVVYFLLRRFFLAF